MSVYRRILLTFHFRSLVTTCCIARLFVGSLNGVVLIASFFVHSDTVTRCAMFCSIYNTIERCKLEGVVDVFQAVKSLRIHRPGAIQTVVSWTYTIQYSSEHRVNKQMMLRELGRREVCGVHYVACVELVSRSHHTFEETLALALSES